MIDRYQNLFARLESEDRIAFIPFVHLGDPHTDEPMPAAQALDASFRIILGLIEAGADALELGIPFSDPVADGPTIQEAAQRALKAGVTPTMALDLVARVRQAHPEIPIGLLVYANLVVGPGIVAFYQRAAESGVDSVLVADVPLDEGGVFSAAARRHGVAPVFIATPECTDAELRRLAALGGGYTYVVTRSGVTGEGITPELQSEVHSRLVQRLAAAGAPAPVFGFGISTPDHVAAAKAVGAAGAISGSAIVRSLVSDGPTSTARKVRELRAAC